VAWLVCLFVLGGRGAKKIKRRVVFFGVCRRVSALCPYRDYFIFLKYNNRDKIVKNEKNKNWIKISKKNNK